MNPYTLRRMWAAFRAAHMLRFQDRETELLAHLAWELHRISYWKFQQTKRLGIQRTKFILWSTDRVRYFQRELKNHTKQKS